ACSNEETWAAQLERELARSHRDGAVECWNAQALGATLQQQLGTFERLRPLAPDVFVVALDGRQDFEATLLAERAAQRGAERTKASDLLVHDERAGADEFVHALVRFKRRPDDIGTALQIALDLTLELDRRCRSAGAGLIVLYVPPANDVE